MARVSIVIHFLTHSVNLSLTMGLLLLIAPMISLGWLFYANLGGHAYSLTGAKTLYAYKRGRLKKVELVCIRNPWGNEVEWKGPWSDHGESLWHFWNIMIFANFSSDWFLWVTIHSWQWKRWSSRQLNLSLKINYICCYVLHVNQRIPRI